MVNEQRRYQDTPLGVLKQWAPLVGGTILTLISIGGFIATVSFMGEHQAKQDTIIDRIQVTLEEQIKLNTHLTTLQEVTDNRLNSIEDWRNGVSDVYINKHHVR